MKTNIEMGSAEIIIELYEGTISVRHGEDHRLLHEVKNAKDGSWDKLWEAIREIESID